MSDASGREAERAAARGDPAAAARLARLRLRQGHDEAPVRRLVDTLTPAGALWIAGGRGYSHRAESALGRVLRDAGHDAKEARELAASDGLWDRLVELCRERAHREWDPIAAIAVLGDRRRIKAALGVGRIDGTGAEERRLRQAWVDALHPALRDTDVATRSWRPPKPAPWPMGWEDLLPVPPRIRIVVHLGDSPWLDPSALPGRVGGPAGGAETPRATDA